jgi:AraC-like DNA-binding protein
LSSELYYKTIEPCAELKPFVECFWVLAAPRNNLEGSSKEVVLPDGKPELIVHFGDDFKKLEKFENEDRFVRQARVLMSGQLTEYIVLQPTGEVGVLAARFKPSGAARFFSLPFEELVNKVVDLASFEESASTLHEQVAMLTSHEQRLDVLQSYLKSRLLKEPQEDIYVREACRFIMESEGEYTVAELVKKIGFSERQLERKFKKQVGLSPKMLSRIVRFQKILKLAQNNQNMTLVDAATSCGYYDQSHFIRDFIKFSGESPLKYLSAEHPMSDHFTTALPTKK